jgi:hypothetical protein
MYAVLLRLTQHEQNHHLELSILDAWVGHVLTGSWSYHLQSYVKFSQEDSFNVGNTLLKLEGDQKNYN